MEEEEKEEEREEVRGPRGSRSPALSFGLTKYNLSEITRCSPVCPQPETEH